jgi:hypothetical protein
MTEVMMKVVYWLSLLTGYTVGFLAGVALVYGA